MGRMSGGCDAGSVGWGRRRTMDPRRSPSDADHPFLDRQKVRYQKCSYVSSQGR